MFQKFLDHIEQQKRYSPHTVVAYGKDLEQYGEYLNSVGVHNPLEVDKHDLRSWLVSQMQSDLARTSVQRKIACLKSFYKYCLKQGEITVNPTQSLVSPKSDKRLPVFVQEKAINALLDKTKIIDFESARDVLVLELFYHTGIRLSELIGIKDRDISHDQKILRVIGKGNKERIIPVSESLLKVIDNYKAHRFDEFGEASPCLIVSNKNKPAYAALIYQIVNKQLANISGLEKRSPHVLRHTFATHMLDNGAELNAIKDLLGHANLSATQIYTHNSLEKLKETFKQAHPKA